MSMDRHRLWREVAANYRAYEQTAPDGYEPRVRIYIAGREVPVEVGQVITRRGDDDQWVAFSTSSTMRQADPDGSPDNGYPDDRLVFAHENTVLRVEIIYVRKDPGAPPRRPIGFSISESSAEL